MPRRAEVQLQAVSNQRKQFMSKGIIAFAQFHQNKQHREVLMSITPDAASRPHKNRIIALALSMMLGFVGADRFYLGKYKSGALKLITFGGLGIWWFVDGCMLLVDAFLWSVGKQSGFVKDAKGQDLLYGLSMYRLQGGRLQKDWFNQPAASV